MLCCQHWKSRPDSEMEPVRIFSTRPDRQISKSSPVDRPVDRFLTGPVDRFFYRRFLFTVQGIEWKIFKRGGGMGEVLNFVTLKGVSEKSAKSFFVFCKNDSILRPFKFRFERPVLSCAKRAQNKHKNRWRAQAELLDVLSIDIMRRPKNEATIF